MKNNSPINNIKISKIIVLIFFITTGLTAAFAPKIFSALIERRIDYLLGKLPLFLTSTYTVCIPVIIALIKMYNLLSNIEKGNVFIIENVKNIDTLANCCICACLICTVSAAYYLPFRMLAVASGFVGLMLKVVKNVFEQAVLLKEDNDYTI